MATKFKFEIESDGLTVEQSQAFSGFVKSLGAAAEAVKNVTEALQPLQDETLQAEDIEAPEPAKKKRASRVKVEEPQAEEVQAEEPQAEEPQAEEAQAEEAQAEEAQAEEAQAEEPKTKTSAYSIQDVRDRVKEKQVKWRTSIKAELERLGSSSVSLLDPEHFEEFCNFMDNLA